MNIQQRTEASDFVNGKFLTKKLDHIEVDTFYHSAHGVIKFLSENHVSIKGLGNSEQRGVYESTNDITIVQLDTLQLKLLTQSDGSLLLTDPDSSWQYNHIVFERLSPESTEQLILPDFDLNPYWVIHADSNSINYGLELFILDSSNVIISQFFDDYAMTSWGDYNTDHYENSLYMYLLDRYSLDDRLIRLYNWEMESYKGQCYEFDFEGPPVKTDFVVKSQQLPSRKSLRSIKKNLLGSWSLIGKGIPFYPDLSDYTRIEQEFFDLDISNSDFEIKYGAIFINETQRDQLSEKIKGTWKLGSTGKYLELNFANGQINYLTLTKLKNDTFSINMSLKTPDSDHGYGSKRIKLKRR